MCFSLGIHITSLTHGNEAIIGCGYDLSPRVLRAACVVIMPLGPGLFVFHPKFAKGMGCEGTEIEWLWLNVQGPQRH